MTDAPRSPFHVRLFLVFWTASLASNIGTWVHEVGAAWLMTELTDSSLYVSLIQAATLGPIFLFGIVAGALADIVNRRTLLLLGQGWSMLSAGLLALLTSQGLVTAESLLLLVFSLGVGTAFSLPAFQAMIPDLVPRDLLRPAVALNGVSINLARTVGPAIAGILLSMSGPAACFTLNAVSFLGVMAVLATWKGGALETNLPPEHLAAAVSSGVRYTWHSPEVHVVLARTVLSALLAASGWALLPVVISARLGLEAASYGLALGIVGVGAISAVPLLGRLRKRITSDGFVVLGTTAFGAMMVALAYAPSFLVLAPFLYLGGFAWLLTMSSLNTAAQLVLPRWVRARGLAVYTMVFAGSMALGATTGGVLADWLGISTALALLGVLLTITSMVSPYLNLARTESMDLNLHPDATLHDADPYPEAHGSAPVLVTIRYTIPPQHRAEFLRAMSMVRRTRVRTGAYFWNLFELRETPGVFLETFHAQSWIHHLRQSERLTRHDREIQLRARQYDVSEGGPTVLHYVSQDTATSQPNRDE